MNEFFIEYKSKPITRLAYKVKSLDEIEESKKECTSVLIFGLAEVEFKHYEPVKVGDFIVYLRGDDIYHCDGAVFSERNEV